MLPSLPGTYALALRLAQPAPLLLRGQATEAPPGVYVYVGSAQGPGGVAARLGRHVRGAGRPRWHIDALRPHAEVVGWHVALGHERLECLWAQALATAPGASVPLAGFGASDCQAGCRAHLVHFPLAVTLDDLWAALLLPA